MRNGKKEKGKSHWGKRNKNSQTQIADIPEFLMILKSIIAKILLLLAQIKNSDI